MSYFKIFKTNDKIYQFKDALGSLSTLVIGSEKALVLDTCYGIGDLEKEIRKVTNLPLIVVNSHGHMDHSCGNYQFEQVYIHSNDVDLAKKHNSLEWRKRNIESAKKANVLPIDFAEDEYLKKREGKLILIDDVDKFSLGDLTLEILPAFGHTRGSIALFCKELKLMIVSDAICQYVWIFLEESTTVSEYVKAVKNILKVDFDDFIVGHVPGLLPKEKMVEYYECAKNIDLDKSNKVVFNNFEEFDSYSYCTDYLYSKNGCGVVFDKKKL